MIIPQYRKKNQYFQSKIKKRSWVFHECLERIPYNIDAMRELLEFGLRGTDLQALTAIGQGNDGGRLIFRTKVLVSKQC